MNRELIRINDYISFFPSSDEPLSSNVFFIEGDDNTYIFDVGRCNEAYDVIEEIKKDKIIIISHFHGDHFDNIERITYSDLYVGSYTFKHINKGNIVKDKVCINDGIQLEIISASSVHAKGSLLLNINKEYCLIGDLVHYEPPLNKSLACMMLLDMEKIDTKYFVLGHRKECVFEKNGFISKLKKDMNIVK